MTNSESLSDRAQRLGIPASEAARRRVWAPVAERRRIYRELYRSQEELDMGAIWKLVPKEESLILHRCRLDVFRERERAADKQFKREQQEREAADSARWVAENSPPKRRRRTKAQIEQDEKARKKALWQARVRREEERKVERARQARERAMARHLDKLMGDLL